MPTAEPESGSAVAAQAATVNAIAAAPTAANSRRNLTDRSSHAHSQTRGTEMCAIDGAQFDDSGCVAAAMLSA